jgi:cytidine deaminase
MIRDRLMEAARKARLNAHAPYSSYLVGAALASEGQDPQIFTGVNVENASYGATVCAERVALFSAVAAGHRGFSAIAVVTSGKEPAPPCGLCLQVLGEFCEDLDVYYSAQESDEIVETTLRDLLPVKFNL